MRVVTRMVVLMASVGCANLASADLVTPLSPIHELQGIASVRVTVSGMPAGLEGTGVTEASLRGATLARLKQAGIKVVDDAAAPGLSLHILPVLHESTWFVTIQVDLGERCSIPRTGAKSGCVTWSTGPTVGIVNKGSESRIEQLLGAAVDRFVSTWRFDNPKKVSSVKTSNYCVQLTAGRLPEAMSTAALARRS